MDMHEFNQGDKVRLRRPAAQQTAIGHSAAPDGVGFGLDGQRVRIPYDALLKVSAHTSATIAKLDADPLPLIARDFINRNQNINALFELVEAAEDE